MKNINKEELKRRINSYCNEHKPINITTESLSVADLVMILKDYYQELVDLNDPKSDAYKEFLDEINGAISPEYAAVLKKRKSDANVGKIRSIIMHGLSIFGSPWHNMKNRCAGMKVCIKHEICGILLDVYEQGQRKPIILCRDIDAGRIHLSKDSNNNERILEIMRTKIVNIFDIVDSYRATLPKSDDTREITEEIINSDDVNSGSFYEVPFANELFKGSIRVLPNGKVTLHTEILIDGEYQDVYQVLDANTISDILDRIVIDMPVLKEPIKSIVLSSFEKEYNVVNGEYRLV